MLENPLRIFIGWDGREVEAFNVAAKTARSYQGVEVIPLYEERLRLSGLLTRTTDRRGQMWDFNSNAPQSTDFAISRFWAFILAHSGWVMFTDCDCVFLLHPKNVLKYADPSKAVMVVKHPSMDLGDKKMDNQLQTSYQRKLWSSVMLINADHPSNKRLNITMLNTWPGRDLHAFRWLHDDEIGELPREWNWLCGMQPKPEQPAIAHFTLGTPNMPGHENDSHASIWYEARESER